MSAELRPLNVTFIAHEASRSGAPMMMLRTLRWLTANSDLRPRVVVRQGGPLVDEFRLHGPTVVAPDRMSLRSRVTRSMPRRLGMARYRLPGAAQAFATADVVYANSSESAELFDLVPMSVPIVAHVHDMAEALHRLPHRTAEVLASRPAHYLVPSEAAAQDAAAVLGIDPARITVAHPFVESIRDRSEPATTNALRATLGVDADTLVVGCAGRIDFCKGVDLMPALCSLVTKRCRAHFVWIGSGDEYLLRLSKRDVRLMGLEEHVTFVDEVADPHGWFSAFDVFCLPSREDSFPLVALENAAVGNPVVCFEGSGGVTEYIDDQAGAVAPFRDLDAMAQAIVELDERSERMARGAVARERSKRYTADSTCREILAVVRETAGRPGAVNSSIAT